MISFSSFGPFRSSTKFTYFILGTVALLATPGIIGECYTLDVKYNNVPGKPSMPMRDGKPLTPDQEKGVAAAIEVLEMVKDSLNPVDGYAGPLPAPAPEDTVPGFLGNVNICQEVRADPQTVGASASDPHTGTGDTADGARTFSTSGHPGINVSSNGLPTPKPDGTHMSGGCTFDGEAVGALAGTLLHESSHLTNPNADASSVEEYEETARMYAGMQICKAVSCVDSAGEPVLSEEVRKGLCNQLKAENAKAKEDGLPPVMCEECSLVGVDVDPIIFAGGGGGKFAPAPTQLSLVQSRRFIGDGYLGKVELWSSALDGKIRFVLTSDTGDFNGSVTFASLGILGFSPLSFTQIDGSGLVVSGTYSNGQSAALVQLDYDLVAGTIAGATLLLEVVNANPAVDICLDASGSTEKLFLLDSVSRNVYVYLFELNQMSLLASSQVYPGLMGSEFISCFSFGSNGFNVVANAAGPNALGVPLIPDSGAYLIDLDGDLSVDYGGGL